MRRLRHRQGFTLAEVMMTVVIVGIMAALAVPSYRKSVEISYWRAAQDVLLTIYTGEMVYEAIDPDHEFVFPLSASSLPSDWLKIALDDPNVGTSIPIDFDVVDGGANGFIATAKHRGDGRCMWVDAQEKLIKFAAQPASTLGCSAAWTRASLQ